MHVKKKYSKKNVTNVEHEFTPHTHTEWKWPIKSLCQLSIKLINSRNLQKFSGETRNFFFLFRQQ